MGAGLNGCNHHANATGTDASILQHLNACEGSQYNGYALRIL